MQCRSPIAIYSKAPWGLAVWSRVTCIFTSTTISPGASLRQCSNHYAFHAGQNLPDKEFRYLRTVIVTAAVHWGLSSVLQIILNTSPWPSSTGQASAPILPLSCLRRPVFLLNSCSSQFSAANLSWLPFLLTYGVNLPSSLTMILPIVLGFSPHLPVSVCGTGPLILNSSFSRQLNSNASVLIVPSLNTRINGFPYFTRNPNSYLLQTFPAVCSFYPTVSLLLSNA